ncbi:uncharacterized protein METZ01_LOCUS40290, partial [marine metagenome]
PRPPRLVRARPAARLLVELPPPRGPGQRRLRRAARRSGGRRRHRPRLGWSPLPPGHARGARARCGARGPAHRLAHPGSRRPGGARSRPGAVRRGCRRRDRCADGRGHRPGAAHRRPRRRIGDRRWFVRRGRRPLPARGAPGPRRRPPHVGRPPARPGPSDRCPCLGRLGGAHPLDPPQLRPLAIRGLPEGVAGHAQTVAQGRAQPPRGPRL